MRYRSTRCVGDCQKTLITLTKQVMPCVLIYLSFIGDKGVIRPRGHPET